MRGGLERAVEWLRPLVDAKDAWDYCVVWKLGDDPTRFIEWVGCCCSGGGGHYRDAKVVDESLKEEHLATLLCRDGHLKHSIRTKACEALQHFPFFMALYSGIHGEVVVTNQPRWLIHDNALDINFPHESNGTRVLIPVFGGLIELFASKHMPIDQNIIDFVVAQCNASTEQIMTAPSYAIASLNEQSLDPSVVDDLQNCPPPIQLLSLMPNMQILHPVTQFNTHLSYEGSSIGSNPSSEHPSFESNYSYVTQNEPPMQSIIQSAGCEQTKYDDNHVLKEQTELVLGCNNEAVTSSKKAIQKPGRENYQAKNLVTERNRRNRIKDGLFTLRALVPKISKMDRAAIIADAIEYIGELHQELKNLKDELKEIEEEESKEKAELKSLNLDGLHEGKTYLPPAEHNKRSGDFAERKTEVLLEVNQIGRGDYLIKFLSEQKRGGFSRLMEALNSLGVQVVDANITTFDGKVLNILKVESHEEDIQLKKLRDSLMALTG